MNKNDTVSTNELWFVILGLLGLLTLPSFGTRIPLAWLSSSGNRLQKMNQGSQAVRGSIYVGFVA